MTLRRAVLLALATLVVIGCELRPDPRVQPLGLLAELQTHYRVVTFDQVKAAYTNQVRVLGAQVHGAPRSQELFTKLPRGGLRVVAMRRLLLELTLA